MMVTYIISLNKSPGLQARIVFVSGLVSLLKAQALHCLTQAWVSRNLGFVLRAV